MSEPQPVLDHVVINVAAGLNEAAERYRRLGFQLTERGHHTLGSSNNLAIFGENYLELLGFEAGRPNPRAELWAHPEGLTGLVFKPPADPGFADQLRARGVPAGEPREFSRPVALPGGSRDASFRVTPLEGIIPDARVFFCQHYTPELVWRDEWRQHPNGVTDIVAFVIACRDPAQGAAMFGRMFGMDQLSPTEGGLRLAAGQAEVLFLDAGEIEGRFGPTAPLPAPEGGDRMAALVLRTASVDRVPLLLEQAGVQFSATIGHVLVPADEACGVVLAFEG